MCPIERNKYNASLPVTRVSLAPGLPRMLRHSSPLVLINTAPVSHDSPSSTKAVEPELRAFP